MLRLILFLTIAPVLGLFPEAAKAQWERDTLFRMLDELEVTATKSTRLLSEVPGRVDVLAREDVEAMPFTKLDDMLRTVSGVNVNRSSGMFTMRPSLSMRGLSGDEQSRTLVMINGTPINTSDEGGVNWNSINTADIEQVEIYKGPGSSLYGSNAMGGVINIVTREPSEPFRARAEINYGTFQTLQSRLSLHSRINDRISFQVNGFYTDSDGYNPVPDSLRELPEYRFAVPRYLREGGGTARVVYEHSELFQVDFSYDIFRDKRGEGTEIQAPDGMYRNFDKNRFRLGIDGRHQAFRYEMNLFFQRENYFMINERMRGDAYQRFDVDSDRDDMGLSLDLFRDFGSRHSLAGGFEIKTGSVDGGDFYQTSEAQAINKGKMRFLAGYLQDEVSLLEDRLHLQLGLRYDHVSFYDGFFRATGEEVSDFAVYNGELEDNSWSTLSPRTAMRYHASDQLSLYLSYSRGFRASILDDLSRSGWMWVGPKIANPELGPETLDNYEFGMDITPLDNLSLSPTLYYARGHDFLYYVETGDLLWGTRPVYRRENVSGVDIFGFEFDMSWHATHEISLFANYAYNHSEIRSFPQRRDLEGMRLTYSPEHQVNGRILWRNEWVDLSASLIYKGRQYTTDDNSEQIDRYVTADVRLARELLQAVSASIQVMDLFDNQHMENRLYMAPGRRVNFSLSYSFP